MRNNLKLICASTISVLASSFVFVMPVLAADDNQTVTSNSTKTATVTYEKTSTFSVAIPKNITLTNQKTANYNITFEADIDADEVVSVIPDSSFVMKDKNGKANVTATVVQDKNEFTNDDTKINGTITAKNLSAGNWSGTLNFTIDLKTIHKHQYTATITQAVSCENDEITKYTCDCGDTYSEHTKAALGHVEVYAGTSGAHTKCSRCGKVLSTSHNYTKQNITQATCTEGGYTTYTCECGYSYTGNNTSALGHSYTQRLMQYTSNSRYYLYQDYCTRCNHVDDTIYSGSDHYDNFGLCNDNQESFRFYWKDAQTAVIWCNNDWCSKHDRTEYTFRVY